MIAVAYTTAPRPKPTLEESLRSFRAAGFMDRVLVVSDGPCDLHAVMPGVEVLENETPLGALRNWVRALSLLVADKSEWVMVCQDDISWALDARETLEASLKGLSLREVGCLSLYAPQRMTKLGEAVNGHKKLKRGWHYKGMQIGRATWGAQCYLFSLPMAKALLAHHVFVSFVNDRSNYKNIDAIVGRSVNTRGAHILYHIPCLVNHDLGDGNSSLGNRDNRPGLATKYFEGPRV